ncbi:MAG: permease [Candidatus Lambdaproteobacteria bacterium]|nr:permease [Candidatus Lambdaproteobacteria bacterium]
MRKGMLTPSFLVMFVLAAAMTVLAWYRGPSVAREGFSAAWGLFWFIMPNLVVGLILGGMIQVLLPRELVAHWAGEESGLRGLAIATVAGAITPGGPFVQFPVVASLWKAGTGIGPITAYVSAWSLLGFQRILVYEGPILGWRFVLTRIAVALMMPIVAGYATAWLFRKGLQYF